MDIAGRGWISRDAAGYRGTLLDIAGRGWILRHTVGYRGPLLDEVSTVTR